MGRYAVIHQGSGIVINVIEWDGDTNNWQPPTGHITVEDVDVIAGPGSSYDGSKFAGPPGGVPGVMYDEERAAAETSAAPAKAPTKKK